MSTYSTKSTLLLVLSVFWSVVLGSISRFDIKCAVRNDGLVLSGSILAHNLSCLGEANDLIPVARIEGSDAYQGYMADALDYHGFHVKRFAVWNTNVDGVLTPSPPPVHDHEAAFQIFEDAIRAIVTSSEAKINGAAGIAAITIPMFFNQTLQLCAFKAAVDVDEKLPQLYGTKESPTKQSWCTLAYPRSTEYCLAERAEELIEGEEPNLVLLVNRVGDRLEIMFAAAKEVGITQRGMQVLPGALDLIEHDRPWTGEATFGKTLMDLVTNNLNHDGAEDGLRLETLDDLKTIVLAGELPDGAINKLRSAIAKVLSGYEYDLQTLHPEYRGAFGAACHAYKVRPTPANTTNLLTLTSIEVYDHFMMSSNRNGVSVTMKVQG